MSKDLWPEEGEWPGEQLGEAFRSRTSGKGEIRVIHQNDRESAGAFRARLAKEKASDHPEALWFLVVRE